MRFVVFCWASMAAGTAAAQTPPSFSLQPTNQTVVAGSNVVCTASATGTPPLHYQWEFGGVALSGATDTSVTVTNVQPYQAGIYTVTVSNDSGGIRSSNALLTVFGPYTVATVAGRAGFAGTNDGSGSTARFWGPAGLVLDQQGNLYIADFGNDTIRKMTPDGVVTTIAGLGGAVGTNDGTGSAARFHWPEGVALDNSSNLYVSDNLNHTIRKITPDGNVSTFVGSPGLAGSQNGTGTGARLYQPNALVFDSVGNLYVSEWGPSGSGASDVRKITPAGVVSTVASSMNGADGIAIDHSGNLYVSEQGNQLIRKITMPAGTKSVWQSISMPYGGTMDAQGNYFLAGILDCTIRVVPGKGILTVAGVSNVAGSADGVGANARFYSSRSAMVVDNFGSFYVSDSGNNTIRRIVPFAVPQIPRSQAVPIGTSVTLNVSASGTDTFAYQWRFSGSPIPGATGTALALGPVTRSNSGVYSVIVSNAIGNWIKFDATVRALVPPVITSFTFTNGNTLHLEFRDQDGGLPFDTENVFVQYRTNLPTPQDVAWQTFTSRVYQVGGTLMFDDTNVVTQIRRFYRILEQ
jgi:sugar lactone lactonase YvrE